MMQTENQACAIGSQATHHRDVPQRMPPVHDLAEKRSGKSFQFDIRAMLEHHFAQVTIQIEFQIVFPCGQTETERRGHNRLEIAWQQRKFCLDEDNTSAKTDRSSEQTANDCFFLVRWLPGTRLPNPGTRR